MSQIISFEDLKHEDDPPKRLYLIGYSGDDIDPDKDEPGQVTLGITGPLDEKDVNKGECGIFDTVIDLELAQAEALAYALLAIVDYVKKTDANGRP